VRVLCVTDCVVCVSAFAECLTETVVCVCVCVCVWCAKSVRDCRCGVGTCEYMWCVCGMKVCLCDACVLNGRPSMCGVPNVCLCTLSYSIGSSSRNTSVLSEHSLGTSVLDTVTSVKPVFARIVRPSHP
jgi:hypothetical protein